MWDMGLALLPVVLGSVIRLLGGQKGPARLLAAPLLLLWLALLPNTAYLLTEFRHAPVRARGLLEPDSSAMEVKTFLFWTAYYVLFSGSGLILFVLAVRPVLQRFSFRRWIPWLLLPLFCLFAALGVYLGLRLRFNSWDLLTQPARVTGAARAVFERGGETLPLIGFFALFLCAAYLAVEIWVEGFTARMRRLRGGARRRPKGAPES